MVVLAASICTRGGKAVLSRQFREMPRSRIEALLASFPKLADSGTQHTTVEQDNVRFVYQPLDELYMVLITNRQSNILQDIDSLHLFAQVVTSTCKSLDEREILKNAYELLSAFDELVTLGYRENLTISQIKTFLEMESHEERIQEIIARNKELEATEERKRKAKQLEMQRKESARAGRIGGGMPRTPSYPTYTPPTRPTPTDTYDSYEAEKNKTFNKLSAPKGKGMQLGKKSKTTDMFERVRGEMGAEVDDTPLITPQPVHAPEPAAESRVSSTLDRDAIHVVVNEAISAKLSREGALNSLAISGDLNLRISDPSLTKVKLNLTANASHGAQFRTHPNVDKNLFNSSKVIQMSNTARGFPTNQSVGVLRWRAAAKADDTSACPITFTVWINKDADKYNMTVEYELTGGDTLKDVSVIIPYQASEPVVSSFDASYEVSGDSLEWNIGTVSEDNPSGSFEFEAETNDENDFFPMTVRFSKTTPFVDVDVIGVSLIEEDEEVTFSKEIKSHADNFLIDETRYDHRVADGFPSSNPAVDLSVSWDASGKNLLVYRPKDQVVSKIHQFAKPGESAPVPQAFLAVGWSDGYVRLMGLENNKAAHHIRVGGDSTTAPRITHIGWSRNVVGKIQASHQQTGPQVWKKLIPEEWDLPGKPAPLDLPRELAFLEVDSALPKISPLPTASAGSGEDGLVFTLRTGVEFLFQPFNMEDSDQVFVMVVGTSDGRLHLSIYDSFVIGDFRYTLPTSLYKPGVLQLMQHASHPEVSTHSLLLRSSTDNDPSVYLLHLQVEYRNTRELPTKFLRSVEGDLEQMARGPTNIIQALFHTVVTGHAYEPVREWLVDSLAERGHKRWDKAVTSGLENLRGLVHENLLPALERCAIILSRLRGLAQFYDSRDDIGFSVAQITRAMDIVSCLTMVGHKILLNVMDELNLFNAFSSWMRFQIDRLAAPGSATDELTEKEATMETSKVLAYIEGYLMQSHMAIFLDEVPKDDYSSNWERAESGASMLDELTTQLTRQEEGLAYLKAFPNVGFLVDYLTARANGIFKDIAEAQKRIYIFRTSIRIINGISSNVTTTVSALSIEEGKIVELKFLNSNTLVLLCQALNYIPYEEGNLPGYSPLSGRLREECTVATLSEDHTFTPVQMDIQDATNARGEIPARICLLGSNRTTYKVFGINTKSISGTTPAETPRRSA
nr:anaphase-promoting complex component cut20 apc4 [Colletotrichum truncatum]KAF6794458.1 anaphase-promoting complex component cut20 apc4 [Colletotrichum truncatum]